jgi:hypothetical protein
MQMIAGTLELSQRQHPHICFVGQFDTRDIQTPWSLCLRILKMSSLIHAGYSGKIEQGYKAPIINKLVYTSRTEQNSPHMLELVSREVGCKHN